MLDYIYSMPQMQVNILSIFFIENIFFLANDEIVKHYDEYPGTTTILGGILLQVQKNNSNAQWAFVFINIGDCKVFRWISKSNQVIDLTGNNRLSLNATDPGGRLGPADTLDVRFELLFFFFFHRI